jgi:hypothetical protein
VRRREKTVEKTWSTHNLFAMKAMKATRAYKLAEQSLEQQVQDDTRPPEEKLENPVAVLCCDRKNAFNTVARNAALDNLAGVASRDYDFRTDGTARILKGTELLHCTKALHSRLLPTYTRCTPSQHGCDTGRQGPSSTSSPRRASNKGILRPCCSGTSRSTPSYAASLEQGTMR